jgi:signal transduction histidine kinase
LREGRAYHCCVEPLYDLAGGIIGVIGVGLDVTERKRVEVAITEYAERLHLLSRQLVEVQERVQQAVARELHDDIGQILTALRLVLTVAMTRQAAGTSVNLNEANSLVDEIQRRVRDLSLMLRPPELDDLGLLAALLMHCNRVSAQTGMHVAVEHTNVDAHRFSSEVETAAYRIVQEALTNVARHARVSNAKVRVWATEDTIGVQVEDAGLGFDPDATVMAHSSSGLAGMHKRVQLLGGHLTVESRPGEGTKITADLPYQSESIAGATAQ